MLRLFTVTNIKSSTHQPWTRIPIAIEHGLRTAAGSTGQDAVAVDQKLGNGRLTVFTERK